MDTRTASAANYKEETPLSQHEFKVDFSLGYELSLIPESDAKLTPKTIEVTTTKKIKEGYPYRVLGLDGKTVETGLIPWRALPPDAPKEEKDILPNKHKLLPAILAYTTEKGHTRSLIPSKETIVALPNSRLAVKTNNQLVEIWDFPDNKRKIIATLEMKSEIHSLNVSPSGKLYVGHESQITVWDLDKRECADTLDVRDMMEKRLAKDAKMSDLIKNHQNTEITITPEGYLFSIRTNSTTDSMAVIDLKSNTCYSVLTTDSFYKGNAQLPAPYIATTYLSHERHGYPEELYCDENGSVQRKADRKLVTAIWNKDTKEPVHAFACRDWWGRGTNNHYKQLWTFKCRIMANKKVMYHAHSDEFEYFSPHSLTTAFQMLGLYKTRLTLFFAPYYHSVDASYPSSFCADFLCPFPDGRHFLCSSYSLDRKADNTKQLRVFDMKLKKYIHETPDIHGTYFMLSDGRVVILNAGGNSHILQYQFMAEYMKTQHKTVVNIKPSAPQLTMTGPK